MQKRNGGRQNAMQIFNPKKKIECLRDFLITAGILAAATGIGFGFYTLGFSEENIIIVYLLGAMIVAVLTASRVWSGLAALFSVLLFNYLFTVPRFSFSAYGSGYPVTFVIAFIAAMIVGNLAVQLKRQAERSDKMAYRTQILLETNQMLQRAVNEKEIVEETAGQIVKLFGRSVVCYCRNKKNLENPVVYPAGQENDLSVYFSDEERETALWAFRNHKRAGAGTDILSGAVCLYLTIRNKNNVYGVVGIDLREMVLTTAEQNLLLSVLGECALALEKEHYNRKRAEAATKAKNEQLRANLLRSISHDLRTPLTSISGNADILLQNHLDEEQRKRTCTYIYEDAIWMINLVENLLSATRIENGTMQLTKHAELLEDIIDEALKHISRKSKEYEIKKELPDEVLLVDVDSRLILQVFINLLDNAVKYTPPGGTISIETETETKFVHVRIADSGIGISEEKKKHIFDMFYMANEKIVDSRRSLGLGLALCRSIVTAHGGTIRVYDNHPKGSVFDFTLPLEEVAIHE